MHKKFKAFTLIELLVVIAIVGILSGFIFVSMSGALNSAKDARRQSDLASIQHAIMAYMAENNNAFPESSASCTMGSGGTCSNLSTNLTPYLKTIPLDPNGTNYTYTYSSSTSSFTIQGTLSNGNTYYYDSSSGQWSQASSPFVGWLYKKTITLSSSLTQDYQIQLTIPYGSGGCESHCKSDFSDLRFASTSGTTLNYWIESYTASTTATVWVKALNTSSSFVMYYGKSDATTTASGDNTFEFFDHFDNGTIDAGKWAKDYSNGSRSIVSSILTITGGAGTGSSYQEDIRTNTTWDNGYATIIYASLSGNDCRLGFPNPRGFFIRGGQWGNFSGTYGCRIYASNWGSFSEVTYGTGYTGYRRFEYRRVSDTQFYTYVNGSQIYNDTLKTPFSYNGGVTLAVVNSGSIAVDWVVVRKCASTEPTSSFGSEQNNS